MSETVQRSGHAVVGRLAPEAMELLWRQGKSMAAISRQGGVSRERVRQILAQRGITGRQPRPKMVMYPQKVEAEGDVHERVVVSTGHLAGRGYICVRKWFRSSREDGQWYPTRLGVNLRADLFTLETLVELAEAMGVGIITGPVSDWRGAIATLSDSPSHTPSRAYGIGSGGGGGGGIGRSTSRRQSADGRSHHGRTRR